MRLCPSCASAHDGANWTCPLCGWSPPVRDGIPILAPDLEDDESGYDARAFELLCAREQGSFWFRARNELIQWAVGRQLGESGTLLEVGCGTGFVLMGLRARFPGMSLTGGELSSRGLAVAASRLPGVELLQMDARAIPFREQFDAVAAFDVIEHIVEDEAVLAQMHGALRPGGTILLTVPQHPFLWSEVDVAARHQRRYRKRDLADKLGRAGFTGLWTTSFVSLLLPALLLSRRRGSAPPEAELALPPLLDRTFDRVMALERAMIRAGLRLPAGGSLLAVATRREVSP